MAKTDSKAPAHARPLGRFRLRVVSYYRRDGKRIVRSWPKKRGGSGPVVVQAWQEDLKFTRGAIKSMSGCTTRFADDVTPRSGYTMWDWLNAMFHGRGLRHVHHGQEPNVLPLLFRDPQNKKWEGAPRVLTPTAKVLRSAAESIANGSFSTLTPNTEVWDTNDFWRSTPTPKRLTIRAKGLYVVSASIEYPAGGAYSVHAHIEDNNGTWYGGHNGQAVSGWNAYLNCIGFGYFNPNDYVEVKTICNAASKTALLKEFSILAITPETIY